MLHERQALRILHIAETIKGGVGTYLNQIVPLQIASRQFETVHVIIPAEQRSQVAAIPEDAIIAVPGLVRDPKSLLRLARTLQTTVDRLKPDIVHAHSSFAGLVSRLIPMLPGRPAIVYCPHGWGFDREGSTVARRVYALIERALAWRADRIVAISEFERRRGLQSGIDPARMALVMNGISDLTETPSVSMSATKDAPLQMLFVGRLDQQKGFDLLLQAVTSLGPAVHLRVAGASVVTGNGSRGTARTPSFPDNVTLLGWLDEWSIIEEMAACEVLVVPSRWEGFGLVAVEAMRAAKPVIASRVGGLPEVVEEGRTGLLFSPGDAEALVDAIAKPSRAEWNRMGQRGRARFLDHFTADRTVAGLMDVYRQCLNK